MEKKNADEIHLQSMKAWHALYNSHVAFLQRQSEYELCFQEIDMFTATARSWETKH